MLAINIYVCVSFSNLKPQNVQSFSYNKSHINPKKKLNQPFGLDS